MDVRARLKRRDTVSSNAYIILPNADYLSVNVTWSTKQQLSYVTALKLKIPISTSLKIIFSARSFNEVGKTGKDYFQQMMCFYFVCSEAEHMRVCIQCHSSKLHIVCDSYYVGLPRRDA